MEIYIYGGVASFLVFIIFVILNIKNMDDSNAAIIIASILVSISSWLYIFYVIFNIILEIIRKHR